MKAKYNFLICLFSLSCASIQANTNIFLIENNQLDKKEQRAFKNSRKFTQTEFNMFIEYLASEIEKKDNFVEKNINKSEVKNEISSEKIRNIDVISDKQRRVDNKFIAEGNVLIRTSNSIFRADQINYDLERKLLYAFGNITFRIDKQYIQASELEYDLINKKGFFTNVYGILDFASLSAIKLKDDIQSAETNNKTKTFSEIKNVRLNNQSGTFQLMENASDIKYDNNRLQRWRFKSDKIIVDNNKWFSKKLILTNDPYNKPQIIINNNDFQSVNKNGRLIVKSKWSSVVLDNKFKIPTGPRRVLIKDDKAKNFRWGIGYDQSARDGIYITRNWDQINLFSEKIKFNFENEFYIQRGFEGNTKSFIKKGESIYSDKITQEASVADFFGLKGILTTKIFDFDFESSTFLNSLDVERLNDTIRNESKLTRTFFEKNTDSSRNEVKLTFFGNYREKIWNGSIGERDILSAYGAKVQKDNEWINNDIENASKIALGYGNYTSSKQDHPQENITRDRLNISLQRKNSYTLWKRKKKNKIDESYKFTPEVIEESLLFNIEGNLDFYRYSDNNYQNLLGFKLGPEITLGSLYNNLFDYTKLSLYPKITLSSGISPFDFDQTVDNRSIEVNLSQQILGPLMIKLSTEYNLDKDSSEYNKFFNNRYEIAWNRRAYNISAYFKEESKAGGILFNIYSFNFDGTGNGF